VVVLDKRLTLKGSAQEEFRQIFPRPGWVEHNPADIWRITVHTIQKAMHSARVRGRDIAGIGITNQRETTVVWERRRGKPIANAIVWQCRRTAPMCADLKARGREAMVREKTGLVLDPYFSGTKVRWLLENVRGAERRAERGDLAFGTIDAFLIWRLSGGKAHVTDVSNASRTLLMDLRRLQWDVDLLDTFGVPRQVLPEIHGSAEEVATTRNVPGLPDGIPIAGVAGDQQAALVGQACFSPGDSKCTYGTGAFLLMNTGTQPVASRSGLLTTVAWRIGGEVNYALEGSSFIAGAAVQWLRDKLGFIESATEVEKLARTVKDSGGVVFVPALAGLGAPHWRADARGLLMGLDRGTTRGHIARAVLEGVALQIGDLLSAMALDAGRPLATLKVDGGASLNDLLMQFQADTLGVPIERPKMIETTALGAAFLAGLGVGYWRSRDDVRRAWKVGKRYAPRMAPEEREKHLAAWRRAVAAA
jgi:glycerol kinase